MGLAASVLVGVVVFLGATVVFDVVHVCLHRLMDARTPWLRAVGGWHAVHHRFLGPDLAVDPSLIGANLRWHVVPEWATHVVFTTSLLLVLGPGPVLVALAIETAVLATILRDRGLDVNHRARARVPAYRPGIMCVPAYHALHHARPAAFYGSWLKIVDQVLGTTVALRGRRAAIVGAPDELRDAMARRLAAETGGPVAILEPDAAGRFPAAARDAELLVLVATVEAPVATIAEWVESAIAASSERLVPVEVWTVVANGTIFAAEGRGYVDDARVIYRHVVAPRPLGGDPARVAGAILARVHRGAHRIHTGARAERIRDWIVGWRGVHPVRRGPRVAALA